VKEGEHHVKRLQVVLAVAIVLVAATLIACGGSGQAASTPSSQATTGASPSATQGPAQAQQADLRIKEGVHAISVALQSWATSQSTVHYPPAADRATLGKYLPGPWPVNPLTDAAMKPGSAAGDYTYRVAADKKSCTVTGHLSDGSPYMPQVLQ
jgi:hypothetical protein